MSEEKYTQHEVKKIIDNTKNAIFAIAELFQRILHKWLELATKILKEINDRIQAANNSNKIQATYKKRVAQLPRVKVPKLVHQIKRFNDQVMSRTPNYPVRKIINT